MVLETEFGYREVNGVVVIDLQPPLRQEVERSHRPGHTRTEISPDALPHLCAMEDSGQQREDRLYQHPSIPGPALTHLHVHWISGLRVKTRVCQDHHRLAKRGDQGVNMRVMDVRRRAVPGTDQAPLVQHHTPLTAHHLPMITVPCLANLVRAAPFPHRRDELSPVAVGAPQHRWRS